MMVATTGPDRVREDPHTDTCLAPSPLRIANRPGTNVQLKPRPGHWDLFGVHTPPTERINMRKRTAKLFLLLSIVSSVSVLPASDPPSSPTTPKSLT